MSNSTRIFRLVACISMAGIVVLALATWLHRARSRHALQVARRTAQTLKISSMYSLS